MSHCILGALRVKNERERIVEAIQSILPVCERVIVFDDHSDDDTVERARGCDARVDVLASPFDGSTDEARDKNHLLQHLITLDPAWILWIDGDEVLEDAGPAVLTQLSHDSTTAVASFRIAYLWDDPNQVRVDGIFGRFRRPSFFRLRGQTNLRFKTTGGVNLHCGNVPDRIRDGETKQLDVRLKHYGYLTQEQRQRKYEWYNAVDPNNRYEDCYRHLISDPASRYAPGPPRFEPWTE